MNGTCTRGPRRKLLQLEVALQGQYTAHHGWLIQSALDLIDLLERQIAELEERIGALAALLKPQTQQLTSIPGVPRVSCWVTRGSICGLEDR